ncbi:hypothetical protein DL768_009335 [Monosporascus sp. mg162]|nr:hypothetical protein DL768_009335 [Monosporascus sp. mg162]
MGNITSLPTVWGQFPNAAAQPGPLQESHGRIGEDAGRQRHSSHGQNESQSARSGDGDKQDPATNRFIAPVTVRDDATVQQLAAPRLRAVATRTKLLLSVAAQRKSSSSPTPSQISSSSSSSSSADPFLAYSTAYPVSWTISPQSEPTLRAPAPATELAVPVHVPKSKSHGHCRSTSKGEAKPLSPHKRREFASLTALLTTRNDGPEAGRERRSRSADIFAGRSESIFSTLRSVGEADAGPLEDGFAATERPALARNGSVASSTFISD